MYGNNITSEISGNEIKIAFFYKIISFLLVIDKISSFFYIITITWHNQSISLSCLMLNVTEYCCVILLRRK